MAHIADQPEAVLSVSEITSRIAGLLGNEFPDVWVRGEVGRVTYHGSGHVYLSLKDGDATLKCAIWRSNVRQLRFRLQEGQEVVARGAIDVYPPRGDYSLIIRHVEPLGEGALRLAFEQLKKRLETEGLFRPSRKQPLPAFPRRVAIVTSRTGAAVRDLVKVMRRRMPSLEVVLVSVRVQGEGAAEEIARGVAWADRSAGADVLIVGRGGGSLEDLWCFNEEVVARAIAACRTPVVSAVGHETDTTIADLVADLRAATPSHAGELVAPDRQEWHARLEATQRTIGRRLRSVLDRAWQRVEALGERPVLRDPLRTVEARRERVEHLAARLASRSPLAELRRRAEKVAGLAARLTPPLRRGVRQRRERLTALGDRLRRAAHSRQAVAAERLEALGQRLAALSPMAVLGRGYSLTRNADGRVVRRAADVGEGDLLRTRLGDGGELDSRVEGRRTPDAPGETT